MIKKLLAPSPLPYDFQEWQQQPFAVRAQWLCQAWALQGFGASPVVYLLYLLKIAFFVWMWGWFASFSSDLGGWSTVGAWWYRPEALVKAMAWSMLFEGLGLSAGSGPLTARYAPPIGGALYFLRPGTIKLPLASQLPFFGRDQRNWFDVALYLAHILQLLRILTAPAVTPAILWPTIPLLLLLGLNDRAAFLASRPEHYLIGLTCFLFPADSLAGAKLVWFGIWFWAATSKLNHHFPAVITVMLSNSGLIRSQWLRRRLYRHFPDDLRPSRLAANLAHAGTITEYLFPLLLLFGGLSTGRIFGLAAPVTLLGLLLMTGFHAFITGHFPMAVPLEWNVMMVYGGYLLFGYHAGVWAFSLSSPWLAAALFLALVVVPLAGNLWPGWISFLLGMRFYAGNWVYSIWLFRDEAEEAIARHVTTTSRLLPRQLRNMYDPDTIVSLLSKVIAFRLMHLHGRALHELLPQAVDDIDRYTWRDGELVAGVVAGWNFGEGFLHNECLLAALQKRCGWQSGELRCIFVDPQPLGGAYLSWRIVDACDGQLATGRIPVADLLERQPWPPGHRVSS